MEMPAHRQAWKMGEVLQGLKGEMGRERLVTNVCRLRLPLVSTSPEVRPAASLSCWAQPHSPFLKGGLHAPISCLSGTDGALSSIPERPPPSAPPASPRPGLCLLRLPAADSPEQVALAVNSTGYGDSLG